MYRAELIKKITDLAEIPNSEGELFLEVLLRKISEEKEAGQDYDITNIAKFTFEKSDNGESRFNFYNNSGSLNYYLHHHSTVLRSSSYSLSSGKPNFPISRNTNNFYLIHDPADFISILESKAEKLIELIEANNEGKIIESFDNASQQDELSESTFDEINLLSFQDPEEYLPEISSLEINDTDNDSEIFEINEDTQASSLNPEATIPGTAADSNEGQISDYINESDTYVNGNNLHVDLPSEDNIELVVSSDNTGIEDEITDSDGSETDNMTVGYHTDIFSNSDDTFDLADLKDEDLFEDLNNEVKENSYSHSLEREVSNEPDTSANLSDSDLSFIELAGKYLEEPEENTLKDNESDAMPLTDPKQTGEKINNDNTNQTETHNYQRVKSLTREFFSLSEAEQKKNLLTWDFGESEQIDQEIKAITRSFDEPIKPEYTKEGFSIVQGKKATMEWKPETLPDLAKTLELEDEENIVVEEIKIKLPEKKKTIPEFVVKEPTEVTRKKHKSRKPLIFSAAVIILCILGALVYIKLQSNITITDIKREINPVVIERNDKVPVMLEGNIEQESISPAFEPPVEKGEFIKINDGLYKQGSSYYVQVSSWQTKYKANKEAERYQLHGYVTEILSSQFRSGTWYRLLVGAFNSEEEAKNFLTNTD